MSSRISILVFGIASLAAAGCSDGSDRKRNVCPDPNPDQMPTGSLQSTASMRLGTLNASDAGPSSAVSVSGLAKSITIDPTKTELRVEYTLSDGSKIAERYHIHR